MLSNTLSEFKRITPAVPGPVRQPQVSPFPSAEQNVWSVEGHHISEGAALSIAQLCCPTTSPVRLSSPREQ